MAKTLAEHAAYELTKAGIIDDDDPRGRKIAVDTMALVKRFEKQNHTETTAKWTLKFFQNICSFMPLTPITDDPEEWEKFEITRKNKDTGEEESKEVWQSTRASSVFSYDEGKTWVDEKNGEQGESVNHIEQAEAKAKEKADREARKKAAEDRKKAPNVLAQPAIDTSVPAGEAPANTPKEEGNDVAPVATKNKPSKK